MTPAAAPRQFLSAPSLPGAGLPHDRISRMAARQAFVELKDAFEQMGASMVKEVADKASKVAG